MDARVEDADRLAVHVDGVRDEDLAVEHAADALGDRALAVAGLAVEQERTAGVDGGADQVVRRVAENEVAQGAVDDFGVDPELADRLQMDDLAVFLEGAPGAGPTY